MASALGGHESFVIMALMPQTHRQIAGEMAQPALITKCLGKRFRLAQVIEDPPLLIEGMQRIAQVEAEINVLLVCGATVGEMLKGRQGLLKGRGRLLLRKPAQLLALLNTPPILDYPWHWSQNSVQIHNFEGVVWLDLVMLPQAGRQCMRTHLPYLHCGAAVAPPSFLLSLICDSDICRRSHSVAHQTKVEEGIREVYRGAPRRSRKPTCHCRRTSAAISIDTTVTPSHNRGDFGYHGREN